ncbi:hypothetical protein SAMN04489712_114152 [Thermomonospora echinospora]|uniref:Uncharacterized protein n=1 Tax=Thermomonospora echinospora TaxID=1992 RepID=A0A1H6D9R7_9ACTN|nr:hypothetical protein [Thermomonospora echinospora]SEG81824.1 hypothetical protein SAMN04489712_114152 [Thermomonospora echinospora]
MVEPLGSLGESATLGELRAMCAAMLPRVDPPELLLEVHSWTGFLDAYTHLADISTRMTGLPRSWLERGCKDARAFGSGVGGVAVLGGFSW